MKHNILYIFLIIFFTLITTSCTINQREFLVLDTSLIHIGQPANEVRSILGPPDARKKIGPEREAWYYYHKRRRFYQRIPIIGSHLGQPEIEVLEVKFFSDRVEKTTFYVTHEEG